MCQRKCDWGNVAKANLQSNRIHNYITLWPVTAIIIWQNNEKSVVRNHMEHPLRDCFVQLNVQKPPKNSKSNHLIENLMSFCLMRQYYWEVYLWLRVEVKKGPTWTDVEMRVGGFYLVNWRHSQAGFVVVTQNQQLKFVLFFLP